MAFSSLVGDLTVHNFFCGSHANTNFIQRCYITTSECELVDCTFEKSIAVDFVFGEGSEDGKKK